MSNLIQHPYHIVDESPWPIFASIFALRLTVGLVKWFYLNSVSLFFLGLFILILTTCQWWRDVSREGSFQGLHTKIVGLGLHWGIILFIISEVFFLSFFWAFFHSRLAVNIEVGGSWPPAGVNPFNPWGVPLLNTIILVSSGIRVTWSHKSIEKNHFNQTLFSLFVTIILGVYFTLLQIIEYYEASFGISDSVYGSTFFIATGFHGLHVIVGTLFLLVCSFRITRGKFRWFHHFGFTAAIWYWHFVDVVWLFLFVWIYVWGSWK